MLLRGAEETESWGERLAQELQPGDVVTLNGPLGAGKTTLVRGLCRGLGIPPEQISSPTFVILQIYEGGRLPVYHFDLYRLKDPSELDHIGAEEFFWGEGVSLIEWPEIAQGKLPFKRIEVRLAQGPEPDCRVVEMQR